MTAALPTTYPHAVRIGIIGGTGLAALTTTGFTTVAQITPSTPWGAPSSPITILTRASDNLSIAFLSRHGLHHSLTPSEVPNTANIAALRYLGVRVLLAFSAVGSLRGEIEPRHFVIPDQIIDRTKSLRTSSFFSGGVVAHVGFADPFDSALREVLLKVAAHDELHVHTAGTVVCMEGPAFSTRAESKMYRAFGGDVINMSAIPEAKLAREAEIAYAMVCMSTDYDCWKEDEKPVDVATVVANMKANGENAKSLVARVIDELAKGKYAELREAEHLRGMSKFACCTAKAGLKAEAVEKVEWLLPGFFA